MFVDEHCDRPGEMLPSVDPVCPAEDHLMLDGLDGTGGVLNWRASRRRRVKSEPPRGCRRLVGLRRREKGLSERCRPLGVMLGRHLSPCCPLLAAALRPDGPDVGSRSLGLWWSLGSGLFDLVLQNLQIAIVERSILPPSR